MNVDAYALRGEWADATARILAMMDSGIAADSYLPEGPSSSTGVERYARALCVKNPRADLGIMYGLASVAVCIAAQGGIIIQCPKVEGGWLTVPAVQQFIGVAPSGWRKSSALGVIEPALERALEGGVRRRRQLANEMMAEEKRRLADENAAAADYLPNEKQINDVFSAGSCPNTLIKDPTVESLRNMAVYNGGCVAVLAGEADVFRNLTQYSQDSASLTFFLDLWDQGKIATSRVGAGVMEMQHAALSMGVLFQTDVFAEVTSGGMGGRGGTGADSFLLRGVFGRQLVVETDQVEGFAEVALAYADDVRHTNTGVNGHLAANGELTPLGLATYEFEQTLDRLVARTDTYRMYKALAQAWKIAAGKYGTDLQVAEIEPVERITLYLPDDGAEIAYNRLQRMYNALEEGLAEMDEDAQIMWGPLVSRYVQHVMREALVIALSAGRDQVSGTDITDAATRLLPWRWALTTRALSKRHHDRVSDILAMAALDNPRGEDRTPEGRVLAAVSRMWRDSETGRDTGWTAEEITARVTSVLPRQARRAIGARVVESALMNLANREDPPLRTVFRAYEGGSETRYILNETAVQYN